MAAVKAIYEKVGIPAAVDKKVNQYFNKGFKNLDHLNGEPGRIEELRRFTRQLIERES